VNVELHCHTYYSDGEDSPEALVRKAMEKSLRWLAITDHDTAQGSRLAAPLAKEFGLPFIPAIELTTRWDLCQAPSDKADIDLLGYFVNLEDAAFQAFERSRLADFISRMEVWCIELTKAGYPIDVDDVYQMNPRYPGTGMLLHALLLKGYVQDGDQAYDLAFSHTQKVPVSSLAIEDAMKEIHTAGGVAVLAHPTILPWDRATRWLDNRGLSTLVEAGLDGIEIFHPRLNHAARAYFLELARPFDLVITGGSDDHGKDGYARLGSEPVTEKIVGALMKRRSGR